MSSGNGSATANITFNAAVDLADATRTINIGANGNYTFNGALGSATPANGGLKITASSGATGSITLNGANTYTGPTSITSGTLYIEDMHASSAITVGDGVNLNTGKLAGTGTLAGTVEVKKGGTIAAGSNASNIFPLTTGAETWDAGGTFAVKLNTKNAAGTAGTDSDELKMSGLSVAASSGAGNTFTIAISSLLGAAEQRFQENPITPGRSPP